MPYIVIDIEGKPLCNDAGAPIVLDTQEEAVRWIKPGEQVVPYLDRRRERTPQGR
ncbi:hypothetical protein [Novosphingobium sp. Gsoil 351]|uniref:hypothetical protein n=1 Tax=Novosphingobium sp. Gsoil 351 TaxID=2675225 RepID=UPI0012B46231|nr:hypothetical protein [Novosphingobium sp. Gsoil 351]QGN55517.1 hypothetical protein GKE62_14105 [Novosphingobium sp. Gsoil 351]